MSLRTPATSLPNPTPSRMSSPLLRRRTRVRCESLAPAATPEETTCSSRPEHRHVARHPATWQLTGSSAAVPAVCHTSAQFQHPEGLKVLWNSRAHRKGRCPKLCNPDGTRVAFYRPPPVLLNLDVRNLSWWMGACSTCGSGFWVVHGWFLIEAMPDRATHFLLIGLTAIAGNFLFAVTAYLGFLEALNPDPSIRQSYMLVKEYFTPVEGEECDCRLTARAVVTQPLSSVPSFGALSYASDPSGMPKVASHSERKWRFWAWEPECMGYMANFFSLLGSVVLFVTCVSGFHPITDTLNQTAITLLFWVPEVVAGLILLIGPVFGMLEVQGKWYKVELFDLGWQASFWNFVGGLGFLMSGILGFASGDPNTAGLGFGLSMFIGSIAFLLSSLALWFEVMNPYDFYD